MLSLGILHGEVARCSADGIRIPAKALEPLGVFDGSVLWGVWIPAPVAPKQKAGRTRRPHLVLSPIHPASWPRAFRLTVNLLDEPGAIRALSRFLEKEKVNILSAECVSCGFRHSPVSIVAEHRDRAAQELNRMRGGLRATAGEGGEDRPANDAYAADGVVDLARRYDESVRDAIQLIESKMRRAGELKRQRELQRSAGEPKHERELQQFLYLSAAKPDLAVATAERLHDLFYNFTHCDVAAGELQFRLSIDPAGMGHLVPVGRTGSWRDADRAQELVMAAIDRRGAYVRLHFDDDLDPTTPWFTYHVRYSVALTPDRPTTRGLYRKVLTSVRREFRGFKAQLVRVANGFQEISPEREAGWIAISVQNPRGRDVAKHFTSAKAKRLRAEIARRTRRFHANIRVEFTAASRPVVFLSRRFDDVFTDEVVAVLSAVARDVGVELVHGRCEGRESISSEILRRIRAADGFILLGTDSDRRGGTGQAWTNAEYGAACVLGKPVAMILDVGPGGRPLEWWHRQYPLHRDRGVFRGTLRRRDRCRALSRAALEFLRDAHLMSGGRSPG